VHDALHSARGIMLDDPFAEEQSGRGKVPAQLSHGTRYIVGRSVAVAERPPKTGDGLSDLEKLPQKSHAKLPTKSVLMPLVL
jgi:hypothetical protein